MSRHREHALDDLRRHIEQHEPEEEERFRTRIEPVALCGDHGKVIAFRNRCPKCAGIVYAPVVKPLKFNAA